MIDPERDWLYRGTTPHWPGSEPLRTLRITPTSTDPLVATIFALECLRFGPAVVQIVLREAVADRIDQPNVLSALEREVVLAMPPEEFSRDHACLQVSAYEAREVLAEIGYELPVSMANKQVFQTLIATSARLRQTDIREFNRLILLRRG
jgi:hypothetical protein